MNKKTRLIDKLGIDVLFCIPFTNKFASISAEDFIKNFLVKNLKMSRIVVGKDYTFGKNRIGNITFLKEYAKKLNFQVIIEDLIQFPNLTKNRISSTLIRSMIMKGDIENANKLLGRTYCIQGIVVSGQNRGGRILGIPTANVHPDNNLYPKTGVYAVTVKYKNKIMNAVANIGSNPTFQNKQITLEVHINSFNHNIYGKKIKINFVKRIRPEIKFSNLKELVSEIHKDIKKANKILEV